MPDLCRAFPALCALIVGLMSALGSTSSHSATEQNFQGLAWGISAQELKAKFGELVGEEPCSKARMVFAEKVAESCDSLGINRYEIAEIPFHLEFGFSKNERLLKRISLFYSGPIGERPVEAIRGKYQRLRALLESRYGKATNDGASSTENVTVFQAEWKLPRTEIRLNADLSQYGEGRENIGISYWPTEAEKL